MLPHLFLIFIVLQLIDVGITHKLLVMGGIEQNPLFLYAFSYGFLGALAVKIIGIVLLYHIVKQLSMKNWRAAFYTLGFINLMYILIILNNFYWYLVLR